MKTEVEEEEEKINVRNEKVGLNKLKRYILS